MKTELLLHRSFERISQAMEPAPSPCLSAQNGKSRSLTTRSHGVCLALCSLLWLYRDMFKGKDIMTVVFLEQEVPFTGPLLSIRTVWPLDMVTAISCQLPLPHAPDSQWSCFRPTMCQPLSQNGARLSLPLVSWLSIWKGGVTGGTWGRNGVKNTGGKKTPE